MASHKNFYENAKEANLRLQFSLVVYDSVPYYVICVVSGHKDGIFRIYMEPSGHAYGSILNRSTGCPFEHPDGEDKIKLMDAWMEANPDSGVVRKFANSSGFNKYRPFDLGMCNYRGKTYYTERTPQRHTQQGLVQNMVSSSCVTLGPSGISSGVNMVSPEFRDTVLGKYPHINDCIENLLDVKIKNETVGFHRNFAIHRGPIGTLFLFYKNDVVGLLKNGNASVLKLATEHWHVKESIDELGVFGQII